MVVNCVRVRDSKLEGEMREPERGLGTLTGETVWTWDGWTGSLHTPSFPGRQRRECVLPSVHLFCQQ